MDEKKGEFEKGGFKRRGAWEGALGMRPAGTGKRAPSKRMDQKLFDSEGIGANTERGEEILAARKSSDRAVVKGGGGGRRRLGGSDFKIRVVAWELP